MDDLRRRLLLIFAHGTAEELAVALALVFHLQPSTPNNSEAGQDFQGPAGSAHNDEIKI